jgi:hypothetical protein
MRIKLNAAALALAAGCGVPLPAAAQSLPHPILFVSQYPVPYDFATIGSVFANHLTGMDEAARGGGLHIRYPDGTLRNLTAEAGYGESGVMQGANAIAVRDPCVHWSGTKAIFSMVIGAPTQQYQVITRYWQLYEVTGLGLGETVSIAPVPNQPADYNNVMPVYGSDGSIVFVSDRPRNGQRHLYPQHDEYESTATPTGLWRLEPGTGTLTLLQHAPSGSFNPLIDSAGRIVFTRWDHLQRDQQNDSPSNEYGTFNYASEAAGAPALADRSEVFPEPRIAVQGSNVNGFTINHFFPWQLNQDGTEEETLDHVGRHELHDYFNSSFSNDPNLDEFISAISGRVNTNGILNVLQIREDPQHAGRYIAIDAPEFYTHGSGQIIRFVATPSTNPDLIQIEYLTHRDTFGTTPSSNHSGHYRNPLVLSDGRMVAAHAAQQGIADNAGTRANPIPTYLFRLRELVAGAGGYRVAGDALTPGNGIARQVQFWDPDVLVSYDGPFWELSPVEVRATPAPPSTALQLRAPELQAFALEGVDPVAFRQFLSANALAVVVMRNVTSRDDADRQQPFNLRVPGGVQTVGAGGTIYDIAHMQFFQGDQIRGRGGQADPAPGRRVLAQVMHDAGPAAWNAPNPGGPPGSVAIFADGSVAAYVPTRRALAWHSTAPNGTPVVRERYWISFQPGEIRACDGCHGVNQQNQASQPAAQNVALAFRDMLARWRTAGGGIFASSFEG